MKCLTHDKRKFHLPDLFDRAANRANPAPDYRVRWVVSRCKVSTATAQTIISNAGFSDGERR